MVTELVPGQNIPIPAENIAVNIKSGKAADFSSFRLYGNGKVKMDADFVFYGQKENDDGTVSLQNDEQQAFFRVDLPNLAADVEKVAFAVTSEFPSIANLGSLDMQVASASSGVLADCRVALNGHDEAALILGEFYKRSGQWKFRFIAQGFRGGLQPLAEFYGVEIADEPKPQPKPEPKPEPKVNLSKVVLTKQAPKIDLAKHETKGGIFGINLNWNQGPAVKKGFFQRKSSGAIDLDLGAFVRLKNGRIEIIQALGGNFGDLDHTPFVKLLGDDRTGEQAGGEWIQINGDQIDKIDEVLIYTFIYEGVPSWKETDAVVSINIPGQPEIETRLSEGDNSLPMCAIARITNQGGQISIERINRYFPGHRDMDKAFGWGLRWQRGSK